MKMSLRTAVCLFSLVCAFALTSGVPTALASLTYYCYCGPASGECGADKTTAEGQFQEDSEVTPGSLSETRLNDACARKCESFSKFFCSASLTPPTTANSTLPNVASGDGDCPQGTVCLINPLDTASIPELVGNIIKAAVGVVGAFALLIFVYGGFILLTSAGEPAKIQAGKDAMKWSVIGLVVVFSSYALVDFVLKSLTK
ncbi:MAG: pilin [Patescibacteria group bacterium]